MLNITTAGDKYNMYKMSNKSNNSANGFATIASKICNNGIRFVSIVVLLLFYFTCIFIKAVPSFHTECIVYKYINI